MPPLRAVAGGVRRPELAGAPLRAACAERLRFLPRASSALQQHVRLLPPLLCALLRQDALQKANLISTNSRFKDREITYLLPSVSSLFPPPAVSSPPLREL